MRRPSRRVSASLRVSPCRVLIVAGSLALAVSPAVAVAEDASVLDDGLYLGFGLGAGLDTTVDLEGGANADITSDVGPVGAITFGYRTATGLRPELEATFRHNDVDDISGSTTSSGSMSSFTVMGNLNFDFQLSDIDPDLRPYVGVGAGLAAVSIDGASPVGTTRVDDKGVVPQIQGIAGVGYGLTDSLEGYVDYRYTVSAGEGSFRTDAGADADGTLSAHTVMVGMRWFFDQPGRISRASALPTVSAVAAAEAEEPAPAKAPAESPPPEPEPEVAAAPEPEQTVEPPRVLPEYLVFFGFDKANVMPEAMEVIRIAADNARGGKTVRIEATGHADRAGTESYNQGLSMRRAEAVRKALIELGVDAAAITVRGEGETRPLVKTADGVREPQNRRVEIILNEG